MTKMKTIRIEKITLNIGAGRDERMLDKGEKLFKQLSTVKPVRTKTNKRIQGWGLRPGLPIGVKSTIRGEEKHELAKKLLTAKDNELQPSYFDNNGNISFGIPEYVDIQGAKYDPEIGIIGLQVCITLNRPGYRIKNRKIGKKKIPTRHRITKEDAMNYFKEQFNTKVSS
jgi:large subunit ribosomal protein L5